MRQHTAGARGNSNRPIWMLTTRPLRWSTPQQTGQRGHPTAVAHFAACRHALTSADSTDLRSETPFWPGGSGYSSLRLYTLLSLTLEHALAPCNCALGLSQTLWPAWASRPVGVPTAARPAPSYQQARLPAAPIEHPRSRLASRQCADIRLLRCSVRPGRWNDTLSMWRPMAPLLLNVTGPPADAASIGVAVVQNWERCFIAKPATAPFGPGVTNDQQSCGNGHKNLRLAGRCSSTGFSTSIVCDPLVSTREDETWDKPGSQLQLVPVFSISTRRWKVMVAGSAAAPPSSGSCTIRRAEKHAPLESLVGKQSCVLVPTTDRANTGCVLVRSAARHSGRPAVKRVPRHPRQ